jgi:hypothetical protein
MGYEGPDDEPTTAPQQAVAGDGEAEGESVAAEAPAAPKAARAKSSSQMGKDLQAKAAAKTISKGRVPLRPRSVPMTGA